MTKFPPVVGDVVTADRKHAGFPPQISQTPRDIKPPAKPSNRLPKKAIRLWRIETLFSGVSLIVAAVLVERSVEEVAPFRPALIVAAVLICLVGVTLLPVVRWERWRFEVREEEIDIQHGIIAITRTLVPMRRVQHVDLRRGQLDRLFGLASVIFYTAAGHHKIPALTEDQAEQVRNQIAELTRNIEDAV